MSSCRSTPESIQFVQHEQRQDSILSVVFNTTPQARTKHNKVTACVLLSGNWNIHPNSTKKEHNPLLNCGINKHTNNHNAFHDKLGVYISSGRRLDTVAVDAQPLDKHASHTTHLAELEHLHAADAWAHPQNVTPVFRVVEVVIRCSLRLGGTLHAGRITPDNKEARASGSDARRKKKSDFCKNSQTGCL